MACLNKLTSFIPTVRLFRQPVAATLMLLFACNSLKAEEVNVELDPLLAQKTGKLINIGSHSMHLFCVGEGLPTVVLEAGLGGLSLEWIKVQAELSTHTRVCAYDRSGYGWSEKSPRQRTSSNIANELHQLLSIARVPGPYVMVGHSFGGYTAQMFSSRHHTSTAGMVLIDASHSEQVERFREIGLNTAPVKRVTHVRYSPPRLPENLPVEAQMTTFQLLVEGHTMPTIAAEYIDFYTSAQQVAAELRIPNVPVMVLTRGIGGWKNSENGKSYEQLWQTLQSELARMSPTSAHLWASKSGHHVHLDQPSLTVNAIMMVVERARLNHNNEIKQVDLVKHQIDKLNWLAFTDASWKLNQIRKRMFAWPVVNINNSMYAYAQH